MARDHLVSPLHGGSVGRRWQLHPDAFGNPESRSVAESSTHRAPRISIQCQFLGESHQEPGSQPGNLGGEPIPSWSA